MDEVDTMQNKRLRSFSKMVAVSMVIDISHAFAYSTIENFSSFRIRVGRI